jgi:uncharacterized membrane-anchored protein
MKVFFASLCILFLSSQVIAQDGDSNDVSDFLTEYLRQDSLLKSLHYKTGTIEIGDGLATVNVPEGCLFLETKDARFLLEDIYGNLPDPGTLGLMLSDTPTVMGSMKWLVDYTYSDDGHVKDDDAADIDYGDMLEQLKKDAEEENKERVSLGKSSLRLVGWAREPFYDRENKKLHWAMEYNFGEDSMNTLNYKIRVLGRKGHMVMNIITSMDQLPQVDKDINTILASTNFKEGNRYADFDSNVDKIAEYGIGGLIAGGILAKTGILAKLGIFFVKFAKLIILGIIGLFALLRNKLFGKKKEETAPAVVSANDTPQNPPAE